jgi:hypothetical protein
VADSRVERTEKALMGRRKNNEVTARAKVRGRGIELGSVMLDMFQNIDVKDGVEEPLA